jgi:hypothetical protein
MPEMYWEADFHAALAKSQRTGVPVFQDFWFDG